MSPFRPLGAVSRQAITVAGAVAQVALPALLLPRFRRDAAPPDVIQPASWTFAVWLPAYAVSLLHAADQARPGRRADPVLREVGAPLAAAYVALGVWAPLVARRSYWAAQGALCLAAVAAGTARRRATGAEQRGGFAEVSTVFAPAAALSAWGTAATGVNLAAMIAAYAPVRTRNGRTGLALATLTTISGTATLAVRRAGPSTATTRTYAGVVLWALAGIAAGQWRHDRAAAITALVGGLPVLAALGRAEGESADDLSAR